MGAPLSVELMLYLKAGYITLVRIYPAVSMVAYT